MPLPFYEFRREIVTKKILSFALLLALLCCAWGAYAEETGFQTPTVLDASDLAGVPTHYLLYDREFYEAPCDQPGTVVKMKYNTNMYGEKTYKKTMYVYLPYGYDENGTDRYPVIYFFHGRGCDPTTLLCNPETKNAFDHMISTGVAKPFILVAPTYYYDARHLLYDWEQFPREMREEIMPLVESPYRTYAETADEVGFRASRDHRAICGFSMGSMTTWALFPHMLDVSASFLPFSGPMQDTEAMIAAVEKNEEPFYIYMACGGAEDLAFENCNALAQTLAADPHFSYGPSREENNFFYCLSDNIHQDLTSRYYLYNAFLDGLFQ